MPVCGTRGDCGESVAPTALHPAAERLDAALQRDARHPPCGAASRRRCGGWLSALCALVPRPRRHLVTYHGVFAPAAGIRSRVVPQVEAEGALPASASGASAELVSAAVRAVVRGGAGGRRSGRRGGDLHARGPS